VLHFGGRVKGNIVNHPVFAVSSVLGIPWGWIFTVGVGAFIGIAMYMSRQDQLNYGGSTGGCLGTMLAGVVGAAIGELILDQLFDVGIDDILWVVVTAVIGASLAVTLVAGIASRRSSRSGGGS
jgi:uncharacterized membrane protein YeaQ/YmgE (transglycosylase-associated protein family)